MLSCSKNESNEKVAKNNTTNNINSKLKKSGHELRKEIIQYPIESQRVIFASKTSEEKSEIWKDKLNISMQNTSFNVVQQELLMELYNQLTPNLFVPNSNENRKFYEFHKIWITKAINEFPFFLIKGIVTTIDDNGFVLAPPNPNDCDCSKSSDWCPSRTKCLGPSCNSSSTGCGTLWIYACDGKCGVETNW